MFDACTTVTAFAKHSYLINEIALLQKVLFLLVCKDIVPLSNDTMKSLLFTLTILVTVATGKCKKDGKDKIPSCIQQKIDQIKKEPKWNPPAEVHEYSYNGRRVFYFSSNCCDQYNVVYDEKCNYVCAPSGGYTGKGDMKCTDFKENAKEVRLVWKDER